MARTKLTSFTATFSKTGVNTKKRAGVIAWVRHICYAYFLIKLNNKSVKTLKSLIYSYPSILAQSLQYKGSEDYDWIMFKIGFMKRCMGIMILGMFLYGNVHCQGTHPKFKKQLPKELKEISGTAKDGNSLWVIADNSKNEFYKLDLSGNIIQKIQVSNIVFINPEAITADDTYVYIGDVGDNNGKRISRSIIRISKSGLGRGLVTEVKGEEIRFTFPDEGVVLNKKSNNYDCEAIMSFRDSIYLFTKRRDDGETELYAIPKIPGTFEARIIATFNIQGLVTDAAINQNGTEIALVGYDKGHTKPFISVFSNFSGTQFFKGKQARFELSNEKKLDWQVESISFADENSFFIACEKTNDVPSTLYLFDKNDLSKSKVK